MLQYPPMTGVALCYFTRLRADGYFRAGVQILDDPSENGFRRVRTFYSKEPFSTRGKARHHAEKKLRRFVKNPSLIHAWLDDSTIAIEGDET